MLPRSFPAWDIKAGEGSFFDGRFGLGLLIGFRFSKKVARTGSQDLGLAIGKTQVGHCYWLMLSAHLF